MVTSTSTPGSMEIEVICLTISEGECKSIKRLWILISNLSKVSEPLPQGDLRVVIRRTLVGRRTGPLTLSCLSLARWIRSLETFSRFLTLREVKVIRIRWILGCSCSSRPGFWVVFLAYKEKSMSKVVKTKKV